jgi:hypothetical protein
MVDNQERGYHQLDSCKPTHYSILVHMAIGKTTFYHIKIQKEILHVSLCEKGYSMLAEHKKNEKLGKAKKLELVLSHYQLLTWV